MTSSLIPERPLLISPTLAATIGLEECVMLHVLSELLLRYPLIVRKERRWVELNFDILQENLPFWTLIDIKRIRQNLLEKGLIQLEAVAQNADAFLIAINQAYQKENIVSKNNPQSPNPSGDAFYNHNSNGGATHIPPNWRPSEDFYQLCKQRNIPQNFADERIKEFVMQWRARGKAQYSWNNTFLKFIIKAWEENRTYQGIKELESQMSRSWKPSEDAFSILEHGGISRSFIEDAIPEFILFWRDKGLITSTWNTKFIQHIRFQWERFKSALEHDFTPRLIPADYEPSPACFEVLGMANIDEDFAREQIREFILYWQDRKEAHPSWNTKFLQHVKYKWAYHQQSNLPATQQIQNTIERFTDRSWAE